MLERLLEIGKRLLAEPDLDRMLAAALDGVIELTGAERGILFLGGDGAATEIEKARNLERQDLERPEFEVSRSVIERVRRSGEPFCSANALDEPQLGSAGSVLRLQLLSVICLPIRRDDATVGLVYLDNRSLRGVFSAEAMRAAAHFAELISLAALHALERRRLAARVSDLADQLRQRHRFEEIIGADPRLTDVLRRVARVAPTNARVLILGESGTGKELVARAIHFNSPRRERPFVALNCGALPEPLLESELFGHARGAFTGAATDRRGWFEEADGGTIFLDEVGDTPLPLQVKLLRLLESGEFARVGSTRVQRTDVRVLSATNRDVQTLVRDGKLREDLLYRLNVVEVEMPALRERRSDVPLLARHFLARFNQEHGTDKRFSPAAEAALAVYAFPGNVRELQNIVQRAIVVAEGPLIEPADLPQAVRGTAAPLPGPAVDDQLPFREAKQRVVEAFERAYIEARLRESKGNVAAAARTAGIDVKNLHDKLARYGIDPGEYR